jgi:phospholipase C
VDHHQNTIAIHKTGKSAMGEWTSKTNAKDIHDMGNIKHLVVLMMENRSFDHMLGYLHDPADPATYPIDGLTGSEFNLLNPADPASTAFPVSPNAPDRLPDDPGHEFSDVNTQLFNSPSGPRGSGQPNKGFILNYSQRVGAARAGEVMKCFPRGALPNLSALALEFAVFDGWFSSMPGPTYPNRFFAHAATSKGYIKNAVNSPDFDMPTIFEAIEAVDVKPRHTWRVYFDGIAQAMLFNQFQDPGFARNFKSFKRFLIDARDGNLPTYAFIEPNYATFNAGGGNDQHPPNSASAGDLLIGSVYNAVRKSPQWPNTALLVLYDEHGGFYDHVTPPSARPPDAHTLQFGFDRLGVRVPAVLVSPYIAPKTIVKSPHDGKYFDHTSIAATLKEMCGTAAYLTQRDASAASFKSIMEKGQLRTDTLPFLPAPSSEELLSLPVGTERVNQIYTEMKGGLESSAPLNDLQRTLVDLALELDARKPDSGTPYRRLRRLHSQYDAALLMEEVVTRLVPEKDD